MGAELIDHALQRVNPLGAFPQAPHDLASWEPVVNLLQRPNHFTRSPSKVSNRGGKSMMLGEVEHGEEGLGGIRQGPVTLRRAKRAGASAGMV